MLHFWYNSVHMVTSLSRDKYDVSINGDLKRISAERSGSHLKPFRSSIVDTCCF